MDQEILNTILAQTYSLSQLKHRLKILKSNFLKTFFGGNADETMAPADLEWLKSLPQSFYQKFNKDNVYQIFSGIDSATSSLQTLTIYLTFEPDDATLNQIGAASRKTFFPSLLLDIKLDPNLIAGTALVWKGIYRDFSLRAKVEEKKEQIFREFKRFLR